MANLLFFNIPAHGHINPSLPLVKALVERGHHVTYFTTESYQRRVAATGADIRLYHDVEDQYFESRGLNGTIPQLAAVALLETAEKVLPELIDTAKTLQPDAILYDCMCPWGYYLAQIAGVPGISSSSLMPLAPKVLLNLQNLRLFLPLLAKGFSAGNQANRMAAQLGQRYNVTPLSRLTVLNAPGDLVIAYSSADYVPYADSLPRHTRLIGWTLQEQATDEQFTHTTGRPLVYVSLGTVSNENADFFMQCIRALGGTEYDVLISTGGRFDAGQFGELPANITIRPWVPQTQVLRQAALFITHGGLNSIHDGLFCGLPLLLVPQQTEQTFNARRVVELGAGLMLTKPAATAEAIRRSAERLLTEPSFRTAAQTLGETLHDHGKMGRAIDEIEALIRGSSQRRASAPAAT